MLRWAVLFLVIALVAGVFAFWRLAGTAMWIANVLFVVFLTLFIVTFIMGRRGKKAVPGPEPPVAKAQ
jgi:uncharacterized membrane protein YtjA (UPF0391 family)